MAPVFHFDPEAHVYTLDGVLIPSVTQLLRPISPDFSAIPPEVLERKRALGVAVHLACELHDCDELEGCDSAVEPYLSAWRRFLGDTGAEIVASERQLFHPVLRYAGTLDRLVWIDGVAWLLDLKTSASPLPSYGVQLAGYAELLSVAPADVRGPVRRGTVHLRPDGSYRLHVFDSHNDRATFFALLTIHSFKEAQK